MLSHIIFDRLILCLTILDNQELIEAGRFLGGFTPFVFQERNK